jgi:hypothetical protein
MNIPNVIQEFYRNYQSRPFPEFDARTEVASVLLEAFKAEDGFHLDEQFNSRNEKYFVVFKDDIDFSLSIFFYGTSYNGTYGYEKTLCDDYRGDDFESLVRWICKVAGFLKAYEEEKAKPCEFCGVKCEIVIHNGVLQRSVECYEGQIERLKKRIEVLEF